jgi:hypothetical protein
MVRLEISYIEILVSKPEGSISHGTCRWEDCIDIDLSDIGCHGVDCIQLSVMNIIVNHQVP